MQSDLKKYLNETPIEELLDEWEEICKNNPSKKGYALRGGKLVWVDLTKNKKMKNKLRFKNKDMTTKLKKTIGIVLISPIAIFLLYSIYYISTNDRVSYYNDCGIIRSKSSSELSIKHGSETILYLNVDFKKSGFKSVKTSPTTYFKHSVGDRICFDLSKESTSKHGILMACGYITVSTLLLIVFAVFFYLILYLFDV
jgi:hypothetical protein